jgi:hypothetical protein
MTTGKRGGEEGETSTALDRRVKPGDDKGKKGGGEESKAGRFLTFMRRGVSSPVPGEVITNEASASPLYTAARPLIPQA